MLMYYTHDARGAFEQIDEPKPSGEHLILSQGFSRADADHLVETYGLAEHLLCDVFDVNELPRVEIENNYRYIFLRNSEPAKSKVISYPVLFVIGKDLLLCLSAHKEPTTSLIKNPEHHHPASLQRMLISGILSVAKNYETIIDHIGDTVDSIEQRMRRHEASTQDFYSFVTIESGLGRAKMSLAGLATIVEKLMPAVKTKIENELLDDIRLFSKQLLVEIDSHTQTIKSIRETYSTVANNTLNQRMKMLTALTLLLALPNVFYSMYGMNIPLPFMHEPWVYTALVSFTVLLVVVVYIVARKKKFF